MRRSLAALVYAGIVTGLLFLGLKEWGYDDPYITYRYAQNIAAGVGFVYNPGEQVLSTTTPLFALLLAALTRLLPGVALPYLANGLGVLSVAVGGLSLWSLAQRWQTPLVGWFALALYPAIPLLLRTTGSETPLMLALALGALLAYSHDRYGWSGALAGLATLMRPDALLLAGVLAGAALLRLIRQPQDHSYSRITHLLTGLRPYRLGIGLFLLPLLAWTLYAWYYFGSPLPVTLAAKQAQGVMEISTRFLPGLGRVIQPYLNRPHYWLAFALALLGLGWALRRRSLWLLLISWISLYYLAYTVLGVSSYYWYYTPLVPAFVVLVGLGGQALWQAASMLRLPAGMPVRWVQAAGLGVLALLLLPGQLRHAVDTFRLNDPRLDVYRQTGEWLAAHTPPGARVGLLEVGVIGYYAGRSLVDFAGLLQPEVAAQMQPESTYQDTAAFAIRQYSPEYLVLHAGVFPDLEAGYVAGACQRVAQFDGRNLGYNATLDVYHCANN